MSDQQKQAFAAAAEKGQPVEIAELRTQDTETLANPDGTLTGISYGVAKHVLREGKWVDIDTRLRLSGSRLVTSTTDADISLSADGSGDAAVVDGGGERIAMGWPGKLPKPAVEGNTATYQNVLPNADLVQTALNSGVEQSLVLRRAPASGVVWRIPFGTKGATGKLLSGGRLSITNETGKRILDSSPPIMRDARDVEAPLAVTVSKSSNGFTLGISPDLKWLQDPERAYPVTIDPVTNVSPDYETAHTYVNSGAATTSYFTDPWLTIGKNADGSIRRSYVRFNTGQYVNKNIISATVNTHIALQSSATSRVDMRDSGGISATTTYNTEPPAYALWDSATTVGAGNWQQFDASAMMTQFATHNVYAGTIQLRAYDQSSTAGYKRMDSGEAGPSTAPYLRVTYNSIPDTPAATGVTPHGGTINFTTSLTPTLSASGTDPDAGASLQFQYQVYVHGGGALVATGSVAGVPSGGTAQWTVPAGSLLNTKRYGWHVRTYDGTDYSAYSAWADFTVDRDAPAKPTVSSNTHPAGVSTLNSTGTFSWTAGPLDTADYLYGLDQPNPTTSTTNPSATVSGMGGGAHTFYVRTRDGAGNLSLVATYAFSVTVATVPGSPTGMQATPGDTSAQITWTAPTSDGGSTVTNYTVTTQPNGPSATVAGTERSATVTGLANGTAYTFRVVATNSVGDSVPSSPTTTVTPAGVPGAPTSVQAVAGNRTATVTWATPTSTGGATLASYTVTASPGGASETVPASTTAALITGLTNGVSYTFTVVATNRVGSSPSSSTTPSTTPASTISLSTASVTTLSGQLNAWQHLDGATGDASRWLYPGAIAITGTTAYVAEGGYIRKLDLTTGGVSTVAGRGGEAACSDNTDPNWAGLFPGSMAIAGTNLYFLETCNTVAVKLRAYSLTTHAVSTIIDYGAYVTPTATSLASLDGSLYLVYDNQVQRLNAAMGTTTTIATVAPVSGGQVKLQALTADADFLYAVDTNNGDSGSRLLKIDASSGQVTVVFSNDAIRGAFSIVPTETATFAIVNDRVRRFSNADGSYTTIAGANSSGSIDGVGSTAWLRNASSLVAFGPDLLMSNFATIRRLSAAAPLAASASPPVDKAVPLGNPILSTVAGNNEAVVKNGVGASASFATPRGLAIANGYAYTTDSGYVRRTSLKTGATSTVSGQGGNNQYCYDGEDPAQTGLRPAQSALTTDGNFLYWSDCDYSMQVRRMSLTTGAIDTVASTYPAYFYAISALAVGGDHKLYAGRGHEIDVIDTVNGPGYQTVATFTLPGVNQNDLSVSGVTASGGSLYVSAYYGGCGGPSNLCGALFKVSLPSYTVTVVSERLTGGNAYFYGPLVSVGDKLAGVLTSYGMQNVATSGLATIDKTTGDIELVLDFSVNTLSTDASSPSPTNFSGIDTDGRYLYAISSTTHRLQRLNNGLNLQQVRGASGVQSSVNPLVGASGVCGCPSTADTANPTGTSGDPVNTLTGAQLDQISDATVPGLGVSFSLVRTYNSNDAVIGPFGRGWSYPYGAHLEVDGDQAVAVTEDGQRAAFTDTGIGWVGDPGVHSSLNSVGNGWRLSTRSGRTMDFDGQGQLTGMRDATGLGLTFSYTSGKLNNVQDAANRNYGIVWAGNKISRVNLPDGRHIDYGYTGDLLTSVTDRSGAVWTYAYDGQGRLKSIRDPNNHLQFDNTYGIDGRVIQQADGKGAVTQFGWNAATGTATTTSPEGRVTKDVYRGGVLVSRTTGAGTTSYSYDADLNVISVTSARGDVTTMTYDDSGNRTGVTYGASGPSESFEYNIGNRMTEHVDRRGKKNTYSYDSLGRLEALVDPLGKTTSFTYATGEAISTITDPLGRVTQFTYDAAGNRTSTTSPAGNKTTATYDMIGRLTGVVDPRGNAPGANPNDFKTSVAYDTADRLKSQTDALGRITQYDYDSLGNLRSSTDALNRVTTRTYDAANRLTEIGSPYAAGVAKTVMTYDSDGLLTSVTGPNGQRTQYGYDSSRRRTSVIDPVGSATGAAPATVLAHTTTLRYDAAGNIIERELANPAGGLITLKQAFNSFDQLISSTDASNQQTFFDLDADGRFIKVTDRNGSVTQSAYDDAGRLTSVTDANQRVTQYAYDAAGQLEYATRPTGGQTTYLYDVDGRTTATVSPRGNAPLATPGMFTTSYEYDRAGNLTATQDPLGGRTVTSYDAVNNVLSETDPNGHVTRWNYDALDRVTSIQAPDAGSAELTSYTYDVSGELQNKTDPKGSIWSWSYDASGRVTQATDPLNRLTTYAWTSTDQLRQLVTPLEATQPGAGTITNSFDALNRLATTTYSDGTPGQQYTYDANARVTQHAGGGAVDSLSYDPAGQLKQLSRVPSSGPSQLFKYDYDAAGNVISRTRPDGSVLTYGFDGNDNPTSVADSIGTVSAEYDLADNLIKISLPTQAAPTIQTRTYDAADRVTAVLEKQGNAQLRSSQQTYDLAGNVKTTSDSATGNNAFEYDTANRLSKDCVNAATCLGASSFTAYAYDKVGNRLSKSQSSGSSASVTSYTYDSADQLISTSSDGSAFTAYTYDPNGNQLSGSGPIDTYQLDGALKSSTVGGVTTTYAYDPERNRLSASTDGATPETRRYAWDPNSGDEKLPDLVNETLPDGTVRATTWLNPTLPVALVDQLVNPTRDYLLTDMQRSVASAVSPSGTVSAQFTYDPFGSLRSATGARASAINLRFGAAYWDAISGRYDNRARVYDAGAGRFTSTDPAVEDVNTPAVSSYVYGSNNPLTVWDPTGLCGITDPFDCFEDTVKATYNFGKGVVSAGVDVVKGAYDAATDPVGFFKSLIDSCRQGVNEWPGDTAAAVAQCLDNLNPVAGVRNQFQMGWQLFQQGCYDQAWQAFGSGTTNAALLVTPLGRASWLGEGGLLSRLGQKVKEGRQNLWDTSEYGGSNGPSRSVSKKLGGLSNDFEKRASDVIRERGGGASQVNRIRSDYRDMTLGELAKLANAGDVEAELAIKMAKQAGTKGQRRYGS